MSGPNQQAGQPPRPTPGPRPGAPSPSALAAQAARLSGDPGDPADHPVTAEVAELLEQSAEVAAATDGEFDLAALSRQSELLTAAHERLSSALDDVGRG
ncbi:hypothetical protein [Gordonia sp. VNK21]|uniref:hypothetical protein n=1 Tax=Gordonia sp. VNK21 TaxID=3382483 RepID=UPI0038D45ED4